MSPTLLEGYFYKEFIMQKHIHNILHIVNTCGNIDGSTEERQAMKDAFHENGKALLKAIAQELGLKPSHYDLRSNKGGIAVCGEITMHTDSLYVQISQIGSAGLDILYRSCNGRKDYGGSHSRNNWFAFHDLDNMPRVLEAFKRVQDGKHAMVSLDF